MDQNQIQELTNEWKEVENAPLPDEEDDDFKWFKFVFISYLIQNFLLYEPFKFNWTLYAFTWTKNTNILILYFSWLNFQIN